MNKNTISSSQWRDDDTPRHEKIAAIKQALEAGTYKVDSRTLADCLLVDLFWEQWERLQLSEKRGTA
jgi:anti-sigma28 factor (negative regulator of flagellin synthesis)